MFYFLHFIFNLGPTSIAHSDIAHDIHDWGSNSHTLIRPYEMRLLNLVSTPKIFCNEVVEYMLEEREDE
jgi:hypothetical protein